MLLLPDVSNVTIPVVLQHHQPQSWSPDFGQEVKLGLLLRRTDLNDGQAEAVFG